MQSPCSYVTIAVMATSAPTPRQQLLLDHYMSDSKRNATEAARKAGYKNPRQDGSRIVRQFQHLIDSKVAEQTQEFGLAADKVLSELALIATDPASKDRLRALEILAKINGLMSDKPIADKKSLRDQLEEILKPQPARAESKPRTAKAKLVLVRSA